MNHRIHRHGTIDSTSERAFAALVDGSARHGDVHVAQAQTRGRGRLGRAWHSAPGEGLYASLVLLPPRPWPPAALTVAVGLAVLDAVRGLGTDRARLKWPNDVVVPGRDGDAKLSGILVETRGLALDRPHYVVGVGVNVAQRAFPPELLAERPVTSLELEGVRADTETVLQAFLRAVPARLDAITDAPAALARDYAAATGLVDGTRVHVDAGDAPLTGTLCSFDVTAGVRVVDDGGRGHAFPLDIVRSMARDAGSGDV